MDKDILKKFADTFGTVTTSMVSGCMIRVSVSPLDQLSCTDGMQHSDVTLALTSKKLDDAISSLCDARFASKSLHFSDDVVGNRHISFSDAFNEVQSLESQCGNLISDLHHDLFNKVDSKAPDVPTSSE